MLPDGFNCGNTLFGGYELSKTMILDLSGIFGRASAAYATGCLCPTYIAGSQGVDLLVPLLESEPLAEM